MDDAHLHAFQVDLTEQSSRDRINLVKEHWRAYLQGRAELALLLNKQTILLSAWRAEDRALRSSRARPVVCSDCGARTHTERQGAPEKARVRAQRLPTERAKKSAIC